MINKQGDYFFISTKRTSYVIKILDTGHVSHFSYGVRIDSFEKGLELIHEGFDINIGCGTYYDEDHPMMFMDNLAMEYGTVGKGDSREPALEVRYGGGMSVLDLVYHGHRIFKGKNEDFLPCALSDEENVESLEIVLKDKLLDVFVHLFYSAYEDEDVILRSARIENLMDDVVVLENVSSMMLDLPDSDWELLSFDGAWARERYVTRRPLSPGVIVIDSKLGCSSSEHNSLVYLVRKETSSDSGEAIALNLIYSGNHSERIEVSPFSKTRVLTGINPFNFSWTLEKGGSFATPEAILTYSPNGWNDAALNFHSFIRKYIIRGNWKDRLRPVLINNWEATYFNFTEERLLALASEAKDLGVELFVLDDGWFGRRVDDRSGLGDWICNRTRLPDGLEGLGRKLHSMGLLFGLWVEPEMVNENSALFEKHPDWRISIPGRTPSVGRHQYILDLSRREVVDYLYSALCEAFSLGDVDYVKWDMNRTMSDYFSLSNDCSGMGGFFHRYILGLYELLSKITKRFPDILFESCSAGGNRYDLGMLCFMPQTWTSDNTDIHHRISIQEGTLMGYPQSTMGSHVSASPGHQSLRKSGIESRFNVACWGAFGYELDLTKLCAEDLEAIRGQIAFYKKYRNVLQNGKFRKISSRDDNLVFWSSTLDKTTIVLEYQAFNRPNTGFQDKLRLPFLDRSKCYRISNRNQIIRKEDLGDIFSSYGKGVSEEWTAVVSGRLLCDYGILLGPQFTGNGVFETTRILGDFGSRLYIIEEMD